MACCYPVRSTRASAGLTGRATRKDAARPGCFRLLQGTAPILGKSHPLSRVRGREPSLSPTAILHAAFCLNSDINQRDRGNEVSAEKRAGMMCRLQSQGCHNINIVTPPPVVPQLLGAVVQQNVDWPFQQVYYSGGCDSAETLRLPDMIVDISMTDAKVREK